ncbi:APC family permease [Finegoldia magna]|uniref:APC family permease n=1 Tax=Finegoldia magna TaxID=1260 RepID=UPI000B91C7A3|nr:amino acid permease [Finegoldia magna]OXZ35636.1 amino acid permease [Finegoldia magna]
MKNDVLIDDQKKKSLTVTNLIWMGFTVVWGFGNVVNNYANQGLAVITSWIFIMALYFIPYSLMVGELGSTFKEGQSGLSYWIKQTMGPLLAYLSGWTYWVVHIPYLAQKPQNLMVAGSWAIFRNPKMVKSLNPIVLQALVLIIFLLFVLLAANGIKSIKVLGSIAGTASFVMGILFILLMLAAPALRGVEVASPNMTSIKTYLPNFNLHYLTTISMLVFAVGGCEKISPYVNDTQDAGRNFPKAMLIMALMVTVSAILGSVAMGMMFDTTNVANDLKMNGAYYAFEKLGQYYGIGSSLVIIYALTNFAGQAAALVMSIDAPLKLLLSEADAKYVPNFLRKINDKKVPVGGYKLTTILVSILIIIPALGIGNSNELYNWLLDLNSIVMPMRYMWVFAAYFALKHYLNEKQGVEYRFTKSKSFGKFIAGWCFVFTAFACILGMIPKEGEPFTSQWNFKLMLNILTPVVLLGLGLILPSIAKKEQAKNI